jgi:flagellar protein FliO/FliZ
MITAWDVIRLIFYLGILLGLMYGVLYLMRKYVYRSQGTGASHLNMKVLSTQMIMPKKFISAVKIEGHVYILGITDYSFTLLDKSDAAPEPEQLISGDDSVLARLRKSIKIS